MLAEPTPIIKKPPRYRAESCAVGFIFLVAILTAIFWGIAVNHLAGNVEDDAGGYDVLAVNLAERHIFSYDGQTPTIDRDPGMPLFLAVIYMIFGHNYMAVYIIQTILFGFTSVLLFWLAKKILNDKLAFFAAMLTSLFYAFGQFSIMLMTEMLAAFVLVLVVFFSVRAAETFKYRYFAIAGLAAGYLALTKSITIFLIGFLIAGFLIISARNLNKEIFKKLLVMTLCWAFIIAPWFIRNKIIFHQDAVGVRMTVNLWAQAKKLNFTGPELFQYSMAYALGVPLTQYLFPSYQHRWWESANDAGHLPYPPAIMEMMKKENIEAHSAPVKKFFGSEYGHYYTDAYRDALRDNWHKAIYLAGFEIVKLNVLPSPLSPDFGVDGMFSNQPLSAAKAAIIFGMRLIWIIFFALVAYGIIRSLKNYRQIIFLLIPIVYFCSAYMFFDAISRYALPIYPYYFIFFIIGIGSLAERYKKV